MEHVTDQDMAGEGAIRLDPLDHKIIAVLQENARLSNAEIAARVASSEPTVRRRVDRIDHSRLDEIQEALLLMPEIRFAGVTLGSYDVVTEVWFHSNRELLAFLHERLSKIPGIHRIESLQVVKMIKYAYDWGVQSSA